MVKQYNEFNMGERLMVLRREAGVSLQYVADKCDASKSYIWEIEKGRVNNPSIHTIKVIANMFGMSVSEFIGEAKQEGCSLVHDLALEIVRLTK